MSAKRQGPVWTPEAEHVFHGDSVRPQEAVSAVRHHPGPCRAQAGQPWQRGCGLDQGRYPSRRCTLLASFLLS